MLNVKIRCTLKGQKDSPSPDSSLSSLAIFSAPADAEDIIESVLYQWNPVVCGFTTQMKKQLSLPKSGFLWSDRKALKHGMQV